MFWLLLLLLMLLIPALVALGVWHNARHPSEADPAAIDLPGWQEQ